jgi:hypothetical protein
VTATCSCPVWFAGRVAHKTAGVCGLVTSSTSGAAASIVAAASDLQSHAAVHPLLLVTCSAGAYQDCVAAGFRRIAVPVLVVAQQLISSSGPSVHRRRTGSRLTHRTRQVNSSRPSEPHDVAVDFIVGTALVLACGLSVCCTFVWLKGHSSCCFLHFAVVCCDRHTGNKQSCWLSCAAMCKSAVTCIDGA